MLLHLLCYTYRESLKYYTNNQMVYYIIILTHLTFMSDGDRINTDNWQMTDKIFSLQYQYIIKQISNKNIN